MLAMWAKICLSFDIFGEIILEDIANKLIKRIKAAGFNNFKNLINLFIIN